MSTQSVSLLPAHRDIARTLRAFDAFALTSLSEGTPFSVLEAMAMALPIIATPVGCDCRKSSTTMGSSLI